MNQFKMLTIEHVLIIHVMELKRFGGIKGIRDVSLLTSALAQAELHLFGKQIYTAPYEIAGVYAYHIIKNHPFLDGNKRTGLAVSLTFLRRNNYYLNATKAEIYDFTI